MWQLFWDTVGYFVDSVPRSIKIVLLVLIAAVAYFFGGLRGVIYGVGSIFWVAFIYMVIAHIIYVAREKKKAREAYVPPLTQDDQEDVLEFQEAMQAEPQSHPEAAEEAVATPDSAQTEPAQEAPKKETPPPTQLPTA
jgi:hypothetical protein